MNILKGNVPSTNKRHNKVNLSARMCFGLDELTDDVSNIWRKVTMDPTQTDPWDSNGRKPQNYPIKLNVVPKTEANIIKKNVLIFLSTESRKLSGKK